MLARDRMHAHAYSHMARAMRMLCMCTRMRTHTHTHTHTHTYTHVAISLPRAMRATAQTRRPRNAKRCRIVAASRCHKAAALLSPSPCPPKCGGTSLPHRGNTFAAEFIASAQRASDFLFFSNQSWRRFCIHKVDRISTPFFSNIFSFQS